MVDDGDDLSSSSRLQKSLQNSRDCVTDANVASHSRVVFGDESVEPSSPGVSLHGDIELERAKDEDLESVDISKRDSRYRSERLVSVRVVL